MLQVCTMQKFDKVWPNSLCYYDFATGKKCLFSGCTMHTDHFGPPLSLLAFSGTPIQVVSSLHFTSSSWNAWLLPSSLQPRV